MRALKFQSYDEAIAAIEQLEKGEYRTEGKWTLGQACHHLSYFYKGSLDGFGFKLPWIFRFLFGKSLLKKILGDKPLPLGARTIPASVPAEKVDDAVEIAGAKELLARLRDASGPLHPSPLFGELTPEQWKGLHLRHTAHHLAFMTPGSSAS